MPPRMEATSRKPICSSTWAALRLRLPERQISTIGRPRSQWGGDPIDLVHRSQHRAGHSSQLAVELRGLAHVDQEQALAIGRDPRGVDLDDPTGHERGALGPGRPGAGRSDSAVEVGGHGHVDLLGLGQMEVVHDLHELHLGLAAAQAGVVLALFGHRADRVAAVVVPRVHQGVGGQREDLVVDRPVQGVGIALLEIGAPAAADQQGIAGEDHRLVVEHEAQAAVGVAGGGARDQGVPPELDPVAVVHPNVATAGAPVGGDDRAGAQPLADLRGAGDVIGVHVGLEGVDQLELQLGHQ